MDSRHDQAKGSLEEALAMSKELALEWIGYEKAMLPARVDAGGPSSMTAADSRSEELDAAPARPAAPSC